MKIYIYIYVQIELIIYILNTNSLFHFSTNKAVALKLIIVMDVLKNINNRKKPISTFIISN